MEKKAILVGATGAIGSNLLKLLLASGNFTEVLVLVRKQLEITHPKLKQLVLNFDEINSHSAQITGDVVFCCLGSTKDKTPDRVEYKKIDYQYPLDVAWIAEVNGATGYHLVSSLGANKNSNTFYIKTKGEVERDLKAVPFKNLHIYRPSLLDAERKENRLAEKAINMIMRLVNPLMVGGLKKYRSIKVENVARAMLNQSLNDTRGVFVHESDQIQEISEKQASR